MGTILWRDSQSGYLLCQWLVIPTSQQSEWTTKTFILISSSKDLNAALGFWHYSFHCALHKLLCSTLQHLPVSKRLSECAHPTELYPMPPSAPGIRHSCDYWRTCHLPHYKAEEKSQLAELTSFQTPRTKPASEEVCLKDQTCHSGGRGKRLVHVALADRASSRATMATEWDLDSNLQLKKMER